MRAAMSSLLPIVTTIGSGITADHATFKHTAAACKLFAPAATNDTGPCISTSMGASRVHAVHKTELVYNNTAVSENVAGWKLPLVTATAASYSSAPSGLVPTASVPVNSAVIS